MKRRKMNERGTVLIVSLIIVIALVGLSSVYLTRTLYENNRTSVQEDSLEALYNAYGMIARAEALLNRAEYDPETGRNIALQSALALPSKEVADTGVTVEAIGDPNTTIFFNLYASSQVGRVERQVRVLIREKESFADYNYFVNAHPLGIAGIPTPRGSIHTNKNLDFYFPDGKFVDPVTASNGFGFRAGASEENTSFLGPTNDGAHPIEDLNNADISALKTNATYVVEDGNLEVKMVLGGGTVQVASYTKAGLYDEPDVRDREVQVGEEEVTVEYEVPVYKTETYTETVPIYEDQIETYTVHLDVEEEQEEIYYETVPIYEEQEEIYHTYHGIYEDQQVEKSRQVPVYATRTVTKYTEEEVWVEDPIPTAGTGTDIAIGDGATTPGHWETVSTPYEETETYIDHYDTEIYYVTESVRIGTEEREHTRTVDVQVGTEEVEMTRTITVVVGTVDEERTRTIQVQIGEEDVERTREVLDYMDPRTRIEMEPVYDTITEVVGTKQVYREAVLVSNETVSADGVIYVEGDIIALEGEINGNVTIASNGSIFLTGSLVYVDAAGETAYLNGNDYEKPYEPNPAYVGGSVLGVIANESILYTKDVPNQFELNGSFLSRLGRVGITGIELSETGGVSLVD